MTFEDQKQKDKKLIDPDFLSLLNVGIGGLAAICGLYQIFLYKEDQNHKKKNNQADYLGFQRNIREVIRSIHHFIANLDQLEKFIERVNLRGNNERDIFSLPARYGEASLFLYDFEIELFIKYQEGIFDSLRQYSTSLTAMAQFLSENNEMTSNESRLMFKAELETLINTLNNTRTQDMTNRQLIDWIRRIAFYIYKLIQNIEQAYIRTELY